MLLQQSQLPKAVSCMDCPDDLAKAGIHIQPLLQWPLLEFALTGPSLMMCHGCDCFLALNLFFCLQVSMPVGNRVKRRAIGVGGRRGDFLGCCQGKLLVQALVLYVKLRLELLKIHNVI